MNLIFVSSLVKNVELSKEITSFLEEKNEKFEVINLVELDITMYDSHKEQYDGIPQKIKDLASKMEKANGYIFVTPEYNFSIPPVQTNVIAWLSRIGHDFRKLFSLKYIQLATHSGSGGQDVCNAMRTQFTKLGAVVMPREIISSYQKKIEIDSLHRILTQYIELKS